MYSLRVEAGFSAAHFLADYNGKCENLHGHNYVVRLWVKGRELNQNGMLVDFSLLKKILKEVIYPLDHKNLNDMDFFQNNPSAERIAAHIYREAEAKLPDGIIAEAVDVFENTGSMARYSPA